jgi:hypothetical protein
MLGNWNNSRILVLRWVKIVVPYFTRNGLPTSSRHHLPLTLTPFYHIVNHGFGLRAALAYNMGYPKERREDPVKQQSHLVLSVSFGFFVSKQRDAVQPLIQEVATAQQIFADWRLCGRIEHDHRFDQLQGSDIEDMRLRILNRMRCLFVLVMPIAQFVFVIDKC